MVEKSVLGRGHSLNRIGMQQGRFKVVELQFIHDAQEGSLLRTEG